MNNYQAFRDSREDAPTRPYEAGVFLNNAVKHIYNRGNDNDAVRVLVDAHTAVNDAARQEAA